MAVDFLILAVLTQNEAVERQGIKKMQSMEFKQDSIVSMMVYQKKS